RTIKCNRHLLGCTSPTSQATCRCLSLSSRLRQSFSPESRAPTVVTLLSWKIVSPPYSTDLPSPETSSSRWGPGQVNKEGGRVLSSLASPKVSSSFWLWVDGRCLVGKQRLHSGTPFASPRWLSSLV